MIRQNPKALESFKRPPAPRILHRDGQELSILHRLHAATMGWGGVGGLPKWDVSHRWTTHSVNSNIGTNPPRLPLIHPSIHPSILAVSPWGVGWSRTGGWRARVSQPMADIHSAHMLTSDSSVKVPVYLPSRRSRQKKNKNIMHHTHKRIIRSSFFCWSFFFFYFLCLFLCKVHLPSKKKTSSPLSTPSHPNSPCPSVIFVLLSQDRQPSERLSSKETSRRHWVFGMVQNGMLWLEHTPATLLWDSSTKRLVGRRRVFLFLRFCFDFLLFFLSLSLWFSFPSLFKEKKQQKKSFPPVFLGASLRSVPASNALDVSLHMKSQMVGPGETSGDTEEGGKTR